MSEARTLAVTVFDDEFHPDRMKQGRVTWDRLKDKISDFRPKARKEGNPLWCPADFPVKAYRENANVGEVSCLVFDMDKGIEPKAFFRLWERYEWAIYSSYSHTPDYPKWRAVFPLAQAVKGEDWPRVWAKLSAHLSRNETDRACKDPSRMYFLPICPPDRMGVRIFQENEGEWLDPTEFPDLEPVAVQRGGNYVNRSTGEIHERLDVASILVGDIPDDEKHNTLIRFIYKCRMEGRPIDECRQIVNEAIDNIADHRLKTTKDQTRRKYAEKEVDKTYGKFAPNPTGRRKRNATPGVDRVFAPASPERLAEIAATYQNPYISPQEPVSAASDTPTHPEHAPYPFYSEIEAVYTSLPSNELDAKRILKEADDSASTSPDTLKKWQSECGRNALDTVLPFIAHDPDLTRTMRRIAGEPE